MTIPTMTASQWWARHRQISRIREAIDMFPDMTDEDGEVLAGCLSARLRCQDLTPDQEAAERWWRDRITDTGIEGKRQRCRQTLSDQVETALVKLCLSELLRDEMTDALIRLQIGGCMTPRQAGLWGTHVLPKLKAMEEQKTE